MPGYTLTTATQPSAEKCSYCRAGVRRIWETVYPGDPSKAKERKFTHHIEQGQFVLCGDQPQYCANCTGSCLSRGCNCANP